MNIHFGTGGWRAIIGDGFAKADVQLRAAALEALLGLRAGISSSMRRLWL